MEILFFFVIIVATVSLSSMLFPSDRYPRALPRRARRQRDLEEEPARPRERSSRKGTRRNTQERRAAHSARGDKRTIHNIIEDDVITIAHLNQDFLVEARIAMKEKNWTWFEYTLADGDEEFTLSVADEGKEIYLSHRIEDLEIGYPPPEKVTYEDNTYKLKSSGSAESNGERYKYYTYLGPDDFALMVEDWEGDIEYYLGERLHERDITILPGGSAS